MDAPSACRAFPHSLEDLEVFYRERIGKPSDDPDAFSCSLLGAGGYSCFFYGNKAFEFIPGENAKFRFPGDFLNQLSFVQKEYRAEGWYAKTEKELAPFLPQLADALRLKKETIFRNTITEKFACCHSFMQCSDAKACLYPEDRFYNGCEYRKNLEAGRIFYGKNANNQ